MGYARSADVYDAFYLASKNYKDEANHVFKLVRTVLHRNPGALSLLDVACGTGLHLAHFHNWFVHVEGLDLSAEMLAIASKRLPGVRLHQGDMTTFDLRRSFDVVTCLFSAVGYLTTPDQLRAGIQRMAAHLRSGGILIVEPWLTPEQWEPARVRPNFVDDPTLAIARICHGRREGRIAHLAMHHLVGRPRGINYFVEHHRLALYTQAEYEKAFNTAGLEVRFDPAGLSANGRGVYIATKPA